MTSIKKFQIYFCIFYTFVPQMIIRFTFDNVYKISKVRLSCIIFHDHSIKHLTETFLFLSILICLFLGVCMM